MTKTNFRVAELGTPLWIKALGLDVADHVSNFNKLKYLFVILTCVQMIIIKTFGGFKSVLLADIIFKLHRLHIVYWQRKLKQFQLNMNH